MTASILYLKEQGVKRLGLTLGRSKRLSCNSINTIAKAKELFPGFQKRTFFLGLYQSRRWRGCGCFFQRPGRDGIITNGDEIAATILSQYGERKAPLIIGQENLLISRLLNFSTLNSICTSVDEKRSVYSRNGVGNKSFYRLNCLFAVKQCSKNVLSKSPFFFRRLPFRKKRIRKPSCE